MPLPVRRYHSKLLWQCVSDCHSTVGSTNCQVLSVTGGSRVVKVISDSLTTRSRILIARPGEE